jgi:hypothetical protein
VLSFDSLYNAPVDKLKANVDEWTTMIGKVGRLGTQLRDTVASPLKSWKGDDADAARSFIAETAKEFDDAVKEASGIRDILQEAHDRFKKSRDDLHQITDVDAPAQGLKVDSSGEVTANPPFSVADRTTWRGKDNVVDATKDGRAAIEAMEKRILRVRANATEADDTAAWALHVNLRGEKYDFNAPAYTTLASAWEAGSAGNFTGSQNYIFGEMLKNKDAAVVKHIKKLMDSANPLDHVEGLALWAAMVRPGGPWDHKPILADRYGLETLNETYLKDPRGNRAVSYDIWSNIHYGYVGRAAGISRWELEHGAQVPVLAGNTDEGDKITVRVGMDIYDKYGPNLTPQQFQDEVDKALREMEEKKTPQIKQWR